MPRKKYSRLNIRKVLSRWVFVILVLSVAGKFAGKFFTKLEILELEPELIDIEGNSMVSDNQVRSILDLRPGQNILKINIRSLEERLEALPRIKTVNITRDFPNSLKVFVEEVEPMGYLIKNGVRYVVTREGKIFPGLEGPAVKFKTEEPEKIKSLSEFLSNIKVLDGNFYNRIIAADLNYRNELVLYTRDFYLKWPVLDEIDDIVMKRNIYLIVRVIEEYEKKGNKIHYIDLRFVESRGGKIKGAVIVK